MLRKLQANAEAQGIRLEVGEFPDPDGTGDPADPERPVRLTAHAIARIADRIPFSRRISRHLEGTENRAGILSDLLALIVELGRQNPEMVETWADNAVGNLNRVRAERAAQSKAKAAKAAATKNGSDSHHATL